MNLDLARTLGLQINPLLSQLNDALKPDVVVYPGTTLQTVLNLASPGDVIVLAPGRHVVGQLHIPNTLTLTGQAIPTQRVTAADVLPTLASGNAGPTIDGANMMSVVLRGLDFEARQDGAGEVILLQDAQTILMDRIRIVGGANGQKRAIRGNGVDISLIQSHIANCWAAGQDSQAFCAWDGTGPYILTDNYLEAAGENFMFGGADSKDATRIPSDILINGNFFTKQLAWKPIPPATTSGKSCKNLLELKSAKRVIITDNYFERSWTDAQNGYAILFKSVNQNGTAPWSCTEDVLFQGNTLRDVQNGFNIQGETFEPNPNGTTQHGGRTTRITIRGNDLQTTGVAVQVTGAPGVLTIDRTTFVNGYTFLQLAGAPMDSLTVSNVLANHNAYGVKGEATGIGTPSLIKFATVYDWRENVLLGGAGKGPYPATTWYDLASVPAGITVGKP